MPRGLKSAGNNPQWPEKLRLYVKYNFYRIIVAAGPTKRYMWTSHARGVIECLGVLTILSEAEIQFGLRWCSELMEADFEEETAENINADLEWVVKMMERISDRAHSPKWRTFLEKIYKRIEAKEKEEDHE